MKPRHPASLPRRQDGVVLVVALVLLIAIALMSIAGMSTTSLELKLATHQQARVASFQQAEAGIDAVIGNPANFPVSGTIGTARCTADFHDPARYYDATGSVNCASFDLTTPAGIDLGYSRIATERIAPLLQSAPRYLETSVENLKVAAFRIDSRHDARSSRGSRAEHRQGLIVTVLTPPEETVVRLTDIDTD